MGAGEARTLLLQPLAATSRVPRGSALYALTQPFFQEAFAAHGGGAPPEPPAIRSDRKHCRGAAHYIHWCLRKTAVRLPGAAPGGTPRDEPARQAALAAAAGEAPRRSGL